MAHFLTGALFAATVAYTVYNMQNADAWVLGIALLAWTNLAAYESGRKAGRCIERLSNKSIMGEEK